MKILFYYFCFQSAVCWARVLGLMPQTSNVSGSLGPDATPEEIEFLMHGGETTPFDAVKWSVFALLTRR